MCRSLPPGSVLSWINVKALNVDTPNLNKSTIFECVCVSVCVRCISTHTHTHTHAQSECSSSLVLQYRSAQDARDQAIKWSSAPSSSLLFPHPLPTCIPHFYPPRSLRLLVITSVIRLSLRVVCRPPLQLFSLHPDPSSYVPLLFLGQRSHSCFPNFSVILTIQKLKLLLDLLFGTMFQLTFFKIFQHKRNKN